MTQLKCKKGLCYLFQEGELYTLNHQNKDFCIMLTKHGQKCALTRNKEIISTIDYWIEDYFYYSSPISKRVVIVEKFKHD